FAQRVLISAVIVFSVYNPSDYSISHWLLSGSGPFSAKAVVLIGLAIVYFAVFRIVFGAFRLSGLAAAAVFAALLSLEIVMHAFGAGLASPWVRLQYTALTASVIVIAFGTSWSNLVQQLTGQLVKRYVR